MPDHGEVIARLNHLDKCLDETKEHGEEFANYARREFAAIRQDIMDMKVKDARRVGLFCGAVAVIQFLMGSGWASLAHILGQR